MLYWFANFQIPRSSFQCAEVFVLAEYENNIVSARIYSDRQCINHLDTIEYRVMSRPSDLYEYLLRRDEFSNYEFITQ